MCEPCGSGDTPTILDYLYQDCWNAILDYVPVDDIIKSERVSSRWQTVMLAYLRGFRFSIEYPYPSLGSIEFQRSVSWLLVRDHESHPSLELWTNKLGSSVVSTVCDSEGCLRFIGENCPNLEAVKFLYLPDQLLRTSRTENFRWLKRICFIKCHTVSDSCVREYATSYALEELELHNNERFTGQCLKYIKSNLKSLALNQCKSLEYRNLQTALDRFCDLTKLVLDLGTVHLDHRVMYQKNITLSLSRMHKLEYFEVYGMDKTAFIEAVCSMKNLKHLGGNITYTDRDLENVSRSCRKLESFEVNSNPTAQGLRMMCQNIRLTAFAIYSTSYELILAYLAVCPDLIRLHIGYFGAISRIFIARVVEVRHRLGATRPLHIHIESSFVHLSKHDILKKDECQEVVVHHY